MTSPKQLLSLIISVLLLILIADAYIDDAVTRSTTAMKKVLSSTIKTNYKTIPCVQDDLPKILSLNTTMCTDPNCNNSTSNSCIQYKTPLNTCYNGKSLFPNDTTTWGDYDILDTFTTCSSSHFKNVHQVSKFFKRTFYATQDSSCVNATDSFDAIPLDVCIGPFGEPRPFGIFSLIDEISRIRLLRKSISMVYHSQWTNERK